MASLSCCSARACPRLPKTAAARSFVQRVGQGAQCRSLHGSAAASSPTASTSRAAALLGAGAVLASTSALYLHTISPIQNDATVASPTSTLHNGEAHRGIHVWGSNRYRVVNPDATSSSASSAVKKPRYLVPLSGQSFRDLALHETYAVAVTPKGDLLQWGTGYSPEASAPSPTLRGQNVVQVALTSNKIYARTKDGKVLIVPVSKADQTDTSARPLPTLSWFWQVLGYQNPGVHFVAMDMPPEAGSKKAVSDIQAGRSHLLALSQAGIALCAAVDKDANELAQLGGGSKMLETVSSVQEAVASKEIIQDRDIRYDTALKVIPSLKKLSIAQLAAGDRHSLALTTDGRILGWGNNSLGQLGLGSAYSYPSIPVPTEAMLQASYGKTARVSCKGIAAGGDTSYFLAERKETKRMEDLEASVYGGADNDLVYHDLLASGNGMYGGIGNGSFMSTSQPIRVKTISGLSEFSEAAQRLVSIPIHSISVSSTHAAVVLDNAVHDSVTRQSFGNDVFLFGHNEAYQLGTSKRSNLSVPQHIPPLPYPLSQGVKEKLDAKDKWLGLGKGVLKKEESLDSGSRTHMPHNRLQLAPADKHGTEERIVTGFGNTAVYWRCKA